MRISDGPKGRVELVKLDSDYLRDNPLGDPWRRQFPVYLPPDFDPNHSEGYPVMYDLAGFTGSGHSRVSWKNFGENVPERLDRLIAQGKIGPVIVVFPDCFTSLGGNQYINSSAIGRYADYLVEEVITCIDEKYPTLASREHRAVYGKSSGGYGALMHSMWYGEYWGAAACHSGDCYFEYAYRCDFPNTLNILAKHDRSPAKFLETFASKQKVSGSEVHALMTLAMAATYDPDPDTELGFHLPFDLRTGEIDQDRWARWLENDPVELVEDHADTLQNLKLLFIDCGTVDQYHLQYGARILHQKLQENSVAHHYEEFEDNHSSLDYRLDVSLPKLYEAIR